MPDMLFPENLLEEDTAYSNDMEMEYEEESEPRGAEAYRPSMFFDAASGDFIRQNDGRIKEATGAEAWEQWCHKAICTQRGACEAYGDEFGVDFERVLQAESREEAENILKPADKGSANGRSGREDAVCRPDRIFLEGRSPIRDCADYWLYGTGGDHGQL